MPKLYQITKKVSGLAKGTDIGFYVFFLCLALKLRDDPTYLVPLGLSMGKEQKKEIPMYGAPVLTRYCAG